MLLSQLASCHWHFGWCWPCGQGSQSVIGLQRGAVGDEQRTILEGAALCFFAQQHADLFTPHIHNMQSFSQQDHLGVVRFMSVFVRFREDMTLT